MSWDPVDLPSRHRHKEEPKVPDSASSDEENEDGDFTVYECPGLAPVRRLQGGCGGVRDPVPTSGKKASPNPEAAEPVCLPAVPSAPKAAALCPEMCPSMGPGRGRGASVPSRPGGLEHGLSRLLASRGRRGHFWPSSSKGLEAGQLLTALGTKSTKRSRSRLSHGNGAEPDHQGSD